MAQLMEVHALAKVEGHTEIGFLTCGDGLTEFSFNGSELIIEATPHGLRNLATVVNAAVRGYLAATNGNARGFGGSGGVLSECPAAGCAGM